MQDLLAVTSKKKNGRGNKKQDQSGRPDREKGEKKRTKPTVRIYPENIPIVFGVFKETGRQGGEHKKGHAIAF